MECMLTTSLGRRDSSVHLALLPRLSFVCCWQGFLRTAIQIQTKTFVCSIPTPKADYRSRKHILLFVLLFVLLLLGECLRPAVLMIGIIIYYH